MYTANDIMDMDLKNVIDDEINGVYGIRISEWCSKILYDLNVSIKDYPLDKFDDPYYLLLSMDYFRIAIREENISYVAEEKFKILLRSMLDKAKGIMSRRKWYDLVFQYNKEISFLRYYKYLWEKPNSCYVKKKRHLKLYSNNMLMDLICDNDVKKIIGCKWLKYGIHGEHTRIYPSASAIIAEYNKNTYKFILKKLPFCFLRDLPSIYHTITYIAPRVDISIKMSKHMIKSVYNQPKFQFVLNYKYEYKKFYFLLYRSFNICDSDRDITFYIYKLHRRTRTVTTEDMSAFIPIYKLMLNISRVFSTKNLTRMVGYYI